MIQAGQFSRSAGRRVSPTERLDGLGITIVLHVSPLGGVKADEAMISTISLRIL